MLYYVSNNSFQLFVSKDKKDSKTCTVFSLTSGKIYRGPADQIFNSKRGTVKSLRGYKLKHLKCEHTIYNRFLDQFKNGYSKNVIKKTADKMFNYLTPVDSYAKNTKK